MSVRAALLATALLSATFAPVGVRAAGGDDFTVIAKQFIAEAERRDPLFADGIGVHTYDDELDDYSPAGHAKRIAWLRQWRARFAGMQADNGLGIANFDVPDNRTLLDTIDLELVEDRLEAPMHTDPTNYEGILGDAMYSLVGRHYATPAARLAHVAPRLALVPDVIFAAEAMLTVPTRVSTLQAIDENAGTLELYQSLATEAKAAPPLTQAAIKSALPAALAAIRLFGTYLKTKLLPRSTRPTRIGKAAYDTILAIQDGTNQSREELVADALADFKKNRAEMLRLAIPYDKQLFPAKIADETKPNAEDVVVRRVMDKLAATHHPTRDGVFAAAHGALQGIIAFLNANPVVVLPSPSTLHVVPTPDYMAGFAGASMSGPGPFTPMAEAYFYIDKIPASWNAARVSSYLRDFNDYEMRILSIHEAIPGHYVQFRYDAKVPSLVRRVYGNGSYVEGWAVYGEGMMLDAGYDKEDPALRLFQLKWRLREEADTIIDAEYHAGSLTEAQCDDLLERQGYEEKSEALTKWHRLQLSHVQLTTYFAGLDAIRKAQAAERARLGGLFSVADFNTRLLNLGSVEPRYIESLLDGSLPSGVPAPAAVPAPAPVPPSAPAPTAVATPSLVTTPLPASVPAPATVPAAPSPAAAQTITPPSH